MQPVLTSCDPLKINVQSCALTSLLKWAMEGIFCGNSARTASHSDFYDNDLRSYYLWSLTSVINSSSAAMCPCHCLQSPETTFSPRLTLKKRLVNHILGLSPRPQSVSAPAGYSDPLLLRAGSARAQRPLSWSCVCSVIAPLLQEIKKWRYISFTGSYQMKVENAEQRFLCSEWKSEIAW